jgi:hypothetical protein
LGLWHIKGDHGRGRPDRLVIGCRRRLGQLGFDLDDLPLLGELGWSNGEGDAAHQGKSLGVDSLDGAGNREDRVHMCSC